jgi:hypothetical protein
MLINDDTDIRIVKGVHNSDIQRIRIFFKVVYIVGAKTERMNGSLYVI